MKNYSSFRHFMLLVILIFSGTINLIGQEEFRDIDPVGIFVDGFIVTTNGDTLYGKIKCKYKFIENNIAQIQFKANEGEGDTFNAGDIQGFGIDKSSFFPKNDQKEIAWDFYESRPSPKKGLMVFLNRFEKGKITLFQNRSSLKVATYTSKTQSKIDGITFSFSSREGLFIGPSYHVTTQILSSKSWHSSYFVEKGSSGLIKLEKDNFFELLPELFGDCVDIQKEIDKNPELKQFKNFVLLVKIYNRICK